MCAPEAYGSCTYFTDLTGHVHLADTHTPLLAEVLHPIAQRPVHNMGDDDVIARRQCRLENSGGRRHARTKQHGLFPFFQTAERALRRQHRRVISTRIALALGVREVNVAQVGCCRVNRRADAIVLILAPDARGLCCNRCGMQFGPCTTRYRYFVPPQNAQEKLVIANL